MYLQNCTYIYIYVAYCINKYYAACCVCAIFHQAEAEFHNKVCTSSWVLPMASNLTLPEPGCQWRAILFAAYWQPHLLPLPHHFPPCVLSFLVKRSAAKETSVLDGRSRHVIMRFIDWPAAQTVCAVNPLAAPKRNS